MNHDHDIGVPAQRFTITGLLVAPVTHVLFVDERHHAQLRRDLGRVVAAAVVDQNDFVHKITGNVAVSLLQSLGRVISRHDDYEFLAVQHNDRKYGQANKKSYQKGRQNLCTTEALRHGEKQKINWFYLKRRFLVVSKTRAWIFQLSLSSGKMRARKF